MFVSSKISFARTHSDVVVRWLDTEHYKEHEYVLVPMSHPTDSNTCMLDLVDLLLADELNSGTKYFFLCSSTLESPVHIHFWFLSLVSSVLHG